jgi:Tn3 transposase DDE domain-containing protein/AI-2E family transporter
VVLPLLAALLLTSLLEPPVEWLRRRSWSSLAATWTVLAAALLLLAAVVFLVVSRVVPQLGDLTVHVGDSLDRIRGWLVNGPLHLSDRQLGDLTRRLEQELAVHWAADQWLTLSANGIRARARCSGPSSLTWSIIVQMSTGPRCGSVQPRHNWEDLLCVAGRLATWQVRASQIVRALQGGGRPTTPGRTVAEYGRVANALHLLAFIDADDSYRCQIGAQRNLWESHHRLVRKLFHGQPRPVSYANATEEAGGSARRPRAGACAGASMPLLVPCCCGDPWLWLPRGLRGGVQGSPAHRAERPTERSATLRT